MPIKGPECINCSRDPCHHPVNERRCQVNPPKPDSGEELRAVLGRSGTCVATYGAAEGSLGADSTQEGTTCEKGAGGLQSSSEGEAVRLKPPARMREVRLSMRDCIAAQGLCCVHQCKSSSKLRPITT